MTEYKKMLIGAKIKAELADKVRSQAAEENTTISGVVEKIISAYYSGINQNQVTSTMPPSVGTIGWYIVDLRKLDRPKFAWLLELSCRLEEPNYTQLLNNCIHKLEGAYGIANPEFIIKAEELQKGE